MRRTAITAVTAVTAVLVAGAGLTAGSAHASDGRAVSPEGELRSVYLHALDRRPDKGGRTTYLPAADLNCKAGVLRFSFDILTGREADRQLFNANRQTAAIFLALLDRAPDPAGRATYLAMNRAENIDRSTVDIMKSAEYRGRLTRICAGRPSDHVAVYSPDEVVGVVQSLLTAATVGSTGCAVTSIANRMRANRTRAGLATVASYSGQLNAVVAGNATCRFAKQIALAAAWAATIASTGRPVYLNQALRTSVGPTTRTAHYTYTIGRTPADTRAFVGSVTVPKA